MHFNIRRIKLRRLFPFFAVAALLIIMVPAPSYAHEFQSDGPIHAILHVDPEDNPVVNEQQQLNFYVFDDQRKFLGSHCDCAIRVMHGSKALLNSPVNVNDDGPNHVGVVPFVFPSFGSYQIYFSGKPTDGYDFHPFDLGYTETVNQAGHRDDSFKLLLIGIAIIVLALAGMAVFIIRAFRDEWAG